MIDADGVEWVTIGEVATLAGVRPRSIVQARWRGAMPAEDGVVLGRPLWRRSTVDAWLAGRRWGPGRPKVRGGPSEPVPEAPQTP